MLEIDEELRKSLKVHCINKDITMTDYIIEAIKDKMKNDKVKNFK